MRLNRARVIGLTLAVLAVAFVPSAAAQVGGLSGDWKGTWTRDGDALPVTASFVRAGDVWSGTFDSDALQVSGIPLSGVSDLNGRVQFRIKGDQTTTSFDGRIAGDAISGTLTDENGNGVFALARITRTAARVRTRDVMFQSDGVTLAGTLLTPEALGRHPAIVFLHGSGPEGRSANRYLAQKFAERGIVALIYDKRGVGQSTGDWRNANFDALADDAAAGVRFLRVQSEVDGTRLGVYGHSQGGTIAPLVGERVDDLRYGAHDERVPPTESANAIRAALGAGGNRRVTLKMYPNADHTFTIVEPPHNGGWPRHELDYAETIGSWIVAQN